jgi:FkbM family methyltransferase
MKLLSSPFNLVKRTARILSGSDVYIRKQINCSVLYLGNVGTSWPVCPEALLDRPLVYSFGVGEDVSFDLELIRRFDATIHAFDPTPRSVAWITGQQVPETFRFHPFGIADYDGVSSFQPPANPAHVSYTMTTRPGGSPSCELQVKRMQTLLDELQHARIDLLKMDIEGAEYAVIDDLLASGILVKQLLVEFHHRWKEIGISKTKDAVCKLNRAGYRLFAVSPSGEEYGFLNMHML